MALKPSLGLQIVEIERCAAMGIGSGVDDARACRGREPLAQPLRYDEIGHVVEREGAFEAILP